ncbi:MAG: TolC family protein [Solirubrobacterales bacterium]
MKSLRTIRCLVAVSLSLAMFAGCKSRSDYADEVKASRTAAYKQWENRRTQEDEQQPRISGKLSREDSIKLTLGHNKMLERTLQEREFARGQRMVARSGYLPNVSLSAQYARDETVPSFNIPGPNNTSEHIQIGTVNNYSGVLTVTQPIYTGGVTQAQVQIANLTTQLADETVRATTQDVVYTAETAYCNLLLAQHLVDISTDAVRASTVHLDNVQKRRTAGVASDFDVLRAQVELSNFEADLLKSKNAIIISRANLIKVMGISQDSDFTLSDEFVYEPMKISIEQAVQAAFTNRPDLYSREYQIRQQREQLRIARSRYLPNISGFFTNTWSNPSPTNFGSSTNDWGDIWQAGFQGAWPIFDGFQREGAIVEQKARLKQAQIDLVDTEETALYELTQALLSMENAEEFVQSQRMYLKRATEGLRLAEVGYEQGINTQVEVIDAQSALTTARVNYYQSIYSHVAAKLALRRAMGTIIETTGTGAPQDTAGQTQTPAITEVGPSQP